MTRKGRCPPGAPGGEAPSPWPPGLQQRQQHLDAADEHGRVQLPLQHVAQELLDRLLPRAEGSGSRAGTQVPRPASLPGPGCCLQTHFSRVANSWSGSGLSWTWITCSRLRRMMSHRDWDALECCWGGRESAEDPSLAAGPSTARCLDPPGADHPALALRNREENGIGTGTQAPSEEAPGTKHWRGEMAEKRGNQGRLPGEGDVPQSVAKEGASPPTEE